MKNKGTIDDRIREAMGSDYAACYGIKDPRTGLTVWMEPELAIELELIDATEVETYRQFIAANPDPSAFEIED